MFTEVNSNTFEMKTKNFTVRITAEEEPYGLESDYFEKGQAEEIERKIEEGHLSLFCAHFEVYFNGVKLAEGYLGQCIYDSLKEFIDSVGYTRALVSECIQEARYTLNKLKAVYVNQN